MSATAYVLIFAGFKPVARLAVFAIPPFRRYSAVIFWRDKEIRGYRGGAYSAVLCIPIGRRNRSGRRDRVFITCCKGCFRLYSAVGVGGIAAGLQIGFSCPAPLADRKVLFHHLTVEIKVGQGCA